MKKIFVFVSICMILMSCNHKRETQFIQNRYWKHADGFGLTDILVLNSKNFRDDTIFVDNKPIAIFLKLKDFDSNMMIISVIDGKIGTYSNQGKIKFE